MKLIILDRDGVINEDSNEFIKSPDEWIPISGSIDAIAQLYQAGFCIVVATNQSGIGRGLFDIDQLEAMHKKMTDLVSAAGGKITGVFYCPHHPDDNCHCRKPKSGLIDIIECSLNTSALGATIIGDSLRDLESGLKKGCQPFLVKTGKGQQTIEYLNKNPNEDFRNLKVFSNLANAAHFLIDNQ